MRRNDDSVISHKILKMRSSEKGALFKVAIKIPFSLGWIERVNFYIQSNNQKNIYLLKHTKNKDGYAYFEEFLEIETCALYHYHFSFIASGVFQYYKNSNTTGNTSITIEECWKMSVGFDVPSWAKGANMYHIFVDRFKKSNSKIMPAMSKRTIHTNWQEPPVLGANDSGSWNVDFYGGDLSGIIEEIPYLKKLNIDILYLSPIFQSQSNHRYDTADYETVDIYAGTNTDLKNLCDIAHKNGMRIILDAVFNHTGNDSKYFNEYGTYNTVGAYQGSDSPYFDFYKNYWFQGERNFCFWWGMKNLPECDSNSEHWREYICGKDGVIDKWFSLGIDGLRLDVADELSDQFIEEIVKAAKRNKPDSFILGEVWKNPMRMNRGYISSGSSMHSVMNYLLVDALIRYFKYIDIPKLESTLKEVMSEYPDGTIHTLMNFTSTHDISRAIELFATNSFQQYGEWAWNLLDANLDWVKNHSLTPSEYYYGKNTLKPYVTVLAFLPGIFSIFYGDEVGLKGIGNLANRAPFPWGNEDLDLLDFFKTICRIRHEEVFLKEAKFRVLNITPEYFSFERYDEKNSIIVFASRSHHIVDIGKNYEDFKVIFGFNNQEKNTLFPYGALVLKK